MNTKDTVSTGGRRVPAMGRADDLTPTVPAVPAHGSDTESPQAQDRAPAGTQRRPGRIGTGAIVGAVLAVGGGLVVNKLVSDVMREPKRHRMPPWKHQWIGCPSDRLLLRYDRERKQASEVPADADFKRTTSMLKSYVGEELGQVFSTEVRYMSEAERQQYLVHIENGVVFDANGKRMDTRGASSAFSDGGGRAIFVMDHDGEIYMSNEHQAGRLHHSSFVAGESVAAAGEMLIEDGVIRLVSDRSGHYRPRWSQVNQIKERLRQSGVAPDSYTIECTG